MNIMNNINAQFGQKGSIKIEIQNYILFRDLNTIRYKVSSGMTEACCFDKLGFALFLGLIIGFKNSLFLCLMLLNLCEVI